MRNYFLTTLILAITMFAFTNCEKDPFQSTERSQWGNSNGRWSDTAKDCSGNGCRCLPEVIIVGIAAPHNDLVDDLVNGATGVGSGPFIVDYFSMDATQQLFTNLNEYQLGLLQSGEYEVKPYFFEKELYETQKLGRIKFFAARKAVVKNPEASLEDYEFSFEVDIRP
ncbi:MAG: hypothetical protein KDC85_09695 [Saprospiraceae bacterium]|nr:hypothetical protein [Saprospiraceae bacterium]MCB9322932.1 hypothetical protein [Lewinellaceae bacterium]